MALFAACSPEDPTEIVPGMSTQMRIPDGLKTVALVVTASGRPVHCETYPVVAGQVSLPATLGFLRGNQFESIPGGQLTVQVLGFRTEEPAFALQCDLGGTVPNTGAVNPATNEVEPNELVILRRRRLSFGDNRILFLPMPLKESCSDVHCREEDGQTCIGGECVEMDIDQAILPDYKDDLIFGNTNTCFNPELCLDSVTAPVRLVDRETCTFETILGADAPLTDPGNLNVRVHYNTFGTEILDRDYLEDPFQHEGITPDPELPLQFKLAPNLCTSHYLDEEKILRLEASPLCPTKTPFQPICDASRDDDPDNDPTGGTFGTTVAPPGICTMASLTSVESAAYVLMDSSLSMFRYFGEGGLRFAVELPLSSPIARRTRLAFALTPAELDQCAIDPAANEYYTPDIGFSPELDALASVRGQIGDLLGDPANVRADNPPLYMAAAMDGAYQALLDLEPVDSSGFNRRALVVIANRDFGGFCDPDGLTPLQRAQNAFVNDNIYTYTVVLDEGDDIAAVADATSIATAGGTEVFNGVADEAEGAVAVQDILNDLGSCLYQVRQPLIPGQRLPEVATISYLNPLEPGGAPIAIPQNGACNEQSQDDAENASGWAQEGNDATGLVRVCGTPCEDLRNLLNDVAVASALLGSVAPPVPLVVTALCPDDDEYTPAQ